MVREQCMAQALRTCHPSIPRSTLTNCVEFLMIIRGSPLCSAASSASRNTSFLPPVPSSIDDWLATVDAAGGILQHNTLLFRRHSSHVRLTKSFRFSSSFRTQALLCFAGSPIYQSEIALSPRHTYLHKRLYARARLRASRVRHPLRYQFRPWRMHGGASATAC